MEGLRIARERKNVKQKELAKAVGVAPSTIANYEGGTREPSLALLCDIADALDCSLDLLVRGKEKDRHNGRSKEDILKEFDTMTEEELVRLSAFLQAALADKRFQAHLRQDAQAEK